MKIDKFKYENEWESWIGKSIRKFSNKPFKSGLCSDIAVSIEINTYSNKKAFKMKNCGTLVDCHQCILD